MADLATSPLWIDGGTFHALDYRMMLRGLVFNAGTQKAADCAVAAKGTPDMSVNVAAGAVFVAASSSGAGDYYLVSSAGTVNVGIAASDATNARHDLIVARVYDSFYGGASNKATIEVVTGSPTGSPVDPAVPANSFVLARVVVPATAGSIVSGDITDLRVVNAKPTGYAYQTGSDFTAPSNGYVYPLPLALGSLARGAFSVASTSRFVVPVAGVFKVGAKLSLRGSTGGASFQLRKNSGGSTSGGTLVAAGYAELASTGYDQDMIALPKSVLCAAGDYFEVFVNFSNTGQILTSGDGNSYITADYRSE